MSKKQGKKLHYPDHPNKMPEKYVSYVVIRTFFCSGKHVIFRQGRSVNSGLVALIVLFRNVQLPEEKENETPRRLHSHYHKGIRRTHTIIYEELWISRR